MHWQPVHAKPDSAPPQTCPLLCLFTSACASPRTYEALHNTTMVNAIDERKVPSVSDQAPAPASKKGDIKRPLNLMHETKRSTPAYTKLTFEWAPATYNFTNEEAEDSRGLFSHFIPDSELQTIAEYTNRNAELQYAAEASRATPHFHGKHWQPITASELKIWLEITLYQRVYHIRQPMEGYWNTHKDAPVNESLGEYMSVTRFQQIQRYLKVSDPTTETEFDMQGKDY
jgi:hypothetical protein